MRNPRPIFTHLGNAPTVSVCLRTDLCPVAPPLSITDNPALLSLQAAILVLLELKFGLLTSGMLLLLLVVVDRLDPQISTMSISNVLSVVPLLVVSGHQ